MNISDRPIAMSRQIRTHTEFWRQIHDDLWIQHPEWVESNGESPKSDSYVAAHGTVRHFHANGIQ